MSAHRRLYAGLALLVVALAILAAVGARAGTSGPDGIWPPAYAVNRIAVVTADAQIRSYRPDGSDETAISPEDGFFTWPTWAPDAGSMVFSGLVRNADDKPVVTLFEYGMEERVPRPIHEGEPGFGGLLADGVVHYPLWSPDSGKLAFVAVTERHGLSLFVKEMRSPTEAAFVLDRGPLWMSWSTDSARLAVHRSQDHFLVSLDDDLELLRIALESTSYRVPAWRPNLAELTLSKAAAPGEYALFSAPITDSGLAFTQPVAEVGPDSAFLWAPDGSYLAVADDARPVNYRNTPIFVYHRLRVLDAADFSETARVFDNVIAYFWSPDGSRLAMVVAADASGGLRWTLLDAATGSTTELVDFVPSRDQMTMFQFFDQYAYSHSLWSPDGRYLVFSGRLSVEASSAGFMSQPSGGASRVFVIDTGQLSAVESLADGVLGFWSPL